MNIADLLSAERLILLPRVSSKKRALEAVSENIADAAAPISQQDVFTSLNARERLGSTGLGHGVAIPHGRIPGNETALAAVLKLEEPVDYDAADDQPVDLIFALLVPENSTDQHLELLAQLAEFLSKPQIVSELRAATDADTLLALLRRLPSYSAA